MPLPNLVQQFLREECTSYVRKLICGAVAERAPVRALDRFEFNRFTLLIDYEAGTVTIDDDLDVEPSGQAAISLSQLLELLGCGSIR